MSVKVSVIVPCYNVEKYVAECLESILGQSLREIEIIVLNDGSTDGTWNILCEYQKKDDRIKLYEHENRGLGETRNRGINLAVGEYLAFIDSDDFISKKMLEELYDDAKRKDADVAVGEVLTFPDHDKNCLKLRKSLKDIKEFKIDNNSKEKFYKDYYYPRIFSHNAWDKIYRRSMIQNFGIRFGDNKRIFAEDNWFQLQVFMADPNITFVNVPCYYYRQQEDSIMHKPKKQLVERHGEMVRDYVNLINKNGNELSDRKNCALVAFDVLIMEALNQVNTKGSYESYKRALIPIKHHKILRENISTIVKIKAHKLENKATKRWCFVIVSILFQLHLYDLSFYILWKIYKN